MKRILRLSLFALSLLMLAAGAAAVRLSYVNAVALIGPSRGAPPQTPADFGLAYEEVSVTTSDGLTLHGWYLPSQNHAAVIVQHGYHNGRGEMLTIAAMLARHGYGVLMLNARAHGESEGELVTFGLKEVLDIRAGLDYLLALPEVDAERIGALGNSQGSVTALLAAAEYAEIKAYWGNSPYASLDDQVASGVRTFTGLPSFPFAPLIQFFAEREAGFNARQVAPLDHIARIAPRPVYLTAGGSDPIIEAASTERLYNAALEPKTLWVDPAAAHVDIATRQPDEFEKRLIAYFDRYLLGK